MPRVLSTPIPLTRDPFINTPLVRLTPDPRTKAERFWTSTWNSNVGSTAALVDEFGASRIHRFKLPHCGFYSAAQENDDTLWLCGFLDTVVRFTLGTGKLESFKTNAPSALNFQGMILDQPTGKLFAAAFPPPKAHAFTFDFRNRAPGKVQPIPSDAKYARFSFPNGDGTWSLLMHLPGNHLIIWDPRTDALEEVPITPTLEPEKLDVTTYFLIPDAQGRRYFPELGWYNPATRRIEDGPRPRREMTWFRRLGDTAVGCVVDKMGVGVGAWNLATGEVREVCHVPDSNMHNLNVTDSGKVVAVSIYGEFFRFDLATGALETSRRLDSDSVGSLDCICRVDKDRVLGTPFITQRFCEGNLKTKKGEDLGRAAPGAGEIMQLIKAGGKIYMAAYTGAELMEYDPAKPARFPENPRVVADAPGGMRPVGIATDGRVVWYTSSNEYGKLGSVLTRYDTKTGRATYAQSPLPDMQMQKLAHDRAGKALLVGATYHADCQSATPTRNRAVVARLDAESLKVLASREMPEQVHGVEVAGPIGAGRWLLVCRTSERSQWTTIDGRLPADETPTLRPFEASRGWTVRYAGKPGRFVLTHGQDIELWDFRRGLPKLVRLLHHAKDPLRLLSVDGDDVVYGTAHDMFVLDGCLKKL